MPLLACAGVLTTATATIPITGYGATPGEAAARAADAAALLAESHQASALLRSTLGALWSVPTDLPSFAPAERPPGVAGHTWKPGACSEIALPEAQNGAVPEAPAAYTAVWPTGSPVTRHDAALAAEASRRLACHGAHRAALGRALARAGTAEAESRWSTVTEGVRSAGVALDACYQLKPRWDAAPSPAALPPAAPSYGCELAEGSARTQGFGASLDAAREDTARAHLRATTRAALASAIPALNADPATRSSALMDALTPWVTPSRSDLVEQARLTCVAFDAGSGTLSWAASDDCPRADNARGAWTTARDTACAADFDRRQASADAAIRGADPMIHTTLGLIAWQENLACDATCLRSGVAGAHDTPVAVPGVPDRSSIAASRAVLAAAIAAKDVDLASTVFPSLASDAALAAFNRDPDGVWNGLASAGESPSAWVAVDGVYVLRRPAR
jgi:hypothetical protein